MPISASLQTRLTAFAQASGCLNGIKRGLEKESLRVTPTGDLAQTPHSESLGSALTHPHITTDYSEALLEFITEPFEDIEPLLGQLDDIHRFTYSRLASQRERLWPASMPCRLGNDDQIPVARYGTSNSGMMKTIYRIGLGHRYGRSMQTIAGIHYNFSLPDDFWAEYQRQENNTQPLLEFKTERYFGLIRNFRRQFWLLVYLFGASPAVSRCFVQDRPHKLDVFKEVPDTLYLPYATSLRMGDLGYQSDAQKALLVDYNDLRSYLNTLCGAITQSHPEYEALGVKDEVGNYLQLNTSLLQIENEFYSSIRPKRTTQRGETALQALRLRGVEYVEVRCVDLNPYEPLGITAEQMRVMDAFLLNCLLQDSPPTSAREYLQGQENQSRIVNRGREPGLRLERGDGEIGMGDWAREILDQTLACARLLDQAKGGNIYSNAVQQQFAKLTNPELTPSAQLLRDMAASGKSFYSHTSELAEQHRAYFADHPLPAREQDYFSDLAKVSLQEQQALEDKPKLPFDEYLAGYYEQYTCCKCK